MRRAPAVTALLLTAVLLAAPPPAADAAWAVLGAGPAVAVADTMPAGATPTVAVIGADLARTVVLSWDTSWAAGRPADGYVVTRTGGKLGGGLVTVGSCAGIAVPGDVETTYVPAGSAEAQQTCTDLSVVALGTVTYTVTPVFGRWYGKPSAPSEPIT
jgi:hypothetical protein